MKVLFLLILLLPALSTTAHGAVDELALPDIGDSSSAAFSKADEEHFGQEMMRSIRRSGHLLEDGEVDAYIRQLGYRLVSAAGHPARDFHFFVVSEPSINAFAMPGGYIGVHTGLISASRNESELAGVLAHEIAHVTQRHLARHFEQASNMNIPMLAALLASILVGVSNPQLGEAALAATMASSIQMQLDFTRSNEREADRVGIQMLAGAGFDPEGMPGFFERLQQEYRYASTGIPEFLSTHPVTTDRIADARNRATQYPHILPADNLGYRLIQERLKVLSARNRDELARQYEAVASEQDGDPSVASHYGHALLLLQQKKYAQSRKLLAELHKNDNGRIAYMLALAEVENGDGQPARAEEIYQDGLRIHPGNGLLTQAYANHFLQQNRPQEAVRLLRDYSRGRQVVPKIHELLAEAESRSGNKGIAHMALADYYYSLGETPTAIEQLNLARRNGGLDFYYQSLLDARLAQWQDELAARPSRN